MHVLPTCHLYIIAPINQACIAANCVHITLLPMWLHITTLLPRQCMYSMSPFVCVHASVCMPVCVCVCACQYVCVCHAGSLLYCLYCAHSCSSSTTTCAAEGLAWGSLAQQRCMSAHKGSGQSWGKAWRAGRCCLIFTSCTTSTAARPAQGQVPCTISHMMLAMENMSHLSHAVQSNDMHCQLGTITGDTDTAVQTCTAWHI